MAKRVISYFGVSIPPFKEKKLGAGSTTIRFVLTGKIISKKNNEQAIAVRSPARDYIQQKQVNGMISVADARKAVDMVYAKIRGNMEYLKFLAEKKPIIQEQMQVWSDRLQHKGLIFPISKSTVSIRLYIKDKYRRDTVNAQQTIQDLLVDCKVLSDDSDDVLNPINAASARYEDELLYNIAFISLSFRLAK